MFRFLFYTLLNKNVGISGRIKEAWGVNDERIFYNKCKSTL